MENNMEILGIGNFGDSTWKNVNENAQQLDLVKHGF